MGYSQEEMRMRLGYSLKCPIYKLSFYRKEKNGFVYWYADVPNHTEDENEMVMGADAFLELIANTGCSRVTLRFTTTHPIGDDDKEIDDYMYHFYMKSHDEEGAYYINEEDGSEIWICNVTHDVCGEHPNDIYILSYTYNYGD